MYNKSSLLKRADREIDCLLLSWTFIVDFGPLMLQHPFENQLLQFLVSSQTSHGNGGVKFSSSFWPDHAPS